VTRVYTDGGCSGNPGPGGWAFVIADERGVIVEKAGGAILTTNNQMELLAVIKALEYLFTGDEKPEEIGIHTDSQYVQKGITDWIKKWKLNGWKTADKKPVKNRELWQRLDALSSVSALNWSWVKGHAGNPLNERCDELVQAAIKSL
jgi:ribonuclease HI